MRSHSISAGKLLSLILGVLTLADVVLLLLLDALPGRFPPRSHAFLAALALSTIAIASLIFQWTKRTAPIELGKAVLLAAAFLFWAANQFWPDAPQSGPFNDIAIGLFVLDVFLVISGRPGAATAKASVEGNAGSLVAGHSDEGCGCRGCCRRAL